MFELFGSILIGCAFAVAVIACACASALLSTCVVLLTIALIEWKSVLEILKYSSVRRCCGLTIPFSIAGVSVGVITGLSKTPVAGQLLPAVLAMLAAASVFLYNQGSKEGLTALAAIVGLSLAVIIGVIFGASVRPT